MSMRCGVSLEVRQQFDSAPGNLSHPDGSGDRTRCPRRRRHTSQAGSPSLVLLSVKGTIYMLQSAAKLKPIHIAIAIGASSELDIFI
jgi:hypothetical protein